MVHNKKVVAGMALIAGLVGMAWSGSALALPEMQVGSRPGIAAQAQSVESTDAVTPDDNGTMAADDEASSTSN